MSRQLRHFFGCGEDTAKQYREWTYLTTVLGQEEEAGQARGETMGRQITLNAF